MNSYYWRVCYAKYYNKYDHLVLWITYQVKSAVRRDARARTETRNLGKKRFCLFLPMGSKMVQFRKYINYNNSALHAMIINERSNPKVIKSCMITYEVLLLNIFLYNVGCIRVTMLKPLLLSLMTEQLRKQKKTHISLHPLLSCHCFVWLFYKLLYYSPNWTLHFCWVCWFTWEFDYAYQKSTQACVPERVDVKCIITERKVIPVKFRKHYQKGSGRLWCRESLLGINDN